MPIPEFELNRIRRWADRRLPDHIKDEIRIEVDVGRGFVTIFECRPPWHPRIGPEWTRSPVARLRRNAQSALWTLYYSDRNSRFHRYDAFGFKPSTLVDDLLAEIDDDPTCIFWG